MVTSNQSMAEVQGFDGVRVLEFRDPKTALCGKLLAQMDADVVLVEPPAPQPGKRGGRRLPQQLPGEGQDDAEYSEQAREGELGEGPCHLQAETEGGKHQ